MLKKGSDISKMSELAIPVTVTWVHADSCPCPICTALDGKQWNLTDAELDGRVLVDESFGPVWNLDLDEPWTHPHCGCFLEAEADLDTPLLKIRESSPGPEITHVMEKRDLTDIQQFRMNLRAAKNDLGDFRWQIVETNLVLSRLENLVIRLGLPKEIEANARKLIEIQSIVLSLVNTFYLLRAAQLGAGPIGWFFFATGAIATALSGASLVAEIG